MPLTRDQIERVKAEARAQLHHAANPAPPAGPPGDDVTPDVIALAIAQAEADGDTEAADRLAEEAGDLADDDGGDDGGDDDDPPAAKFSARDAPRRDPAASALVGTDGAELERLTRAGLRDTADRLGGVFRAAVRRAVEDGRVGKRGLFTDSEREELADLLAALGASADLLGRARVRELHADAIPAGGFHTFAHGGQAPPVPFRRFADAAASVIRPPAEALDYFSGLVPELGVDPQLFGDLWRRKAFTLAASPELTLTRRVQGVIRAGLESATGTRDVAGAVDHLFRSFGIHVSNPQYAEMIVRTNGNEAYTSAAFAEMRAPDVREDFPAWQYLGIADERQGDDHRPHNDKYYPAEAPFAKVRGPRVFNCRCNFRPVDRYEWADLSGRGVRLETRW